MQLIHTIGKLQTALKPHRKQKIALVATMGNLHYGHLTLVQIAKKYADVVAVSIFVNPTQFGAGEDFDRYPRTLDDDIVKLYGVGVDLVFAPSIDEMYPTYPPNIQLLGGDMTKILCGRMRPTHFDGVGLVVAKLFNIIRPDIAVFGKKDYQQLAIIRQLNEELNFGVEIIGAPIVRADDGLALSSRNGYLSDDERMRAPMIFATLQQIAKQIALADFADYATILHQHHQQLQEKGFDVDYLSLYNDKLQVAVPDDRHLVVLCAVYIGRARLLDNIEIDLS